MSPTPLSRRRFLRWVGRGVVYGGGALAVADALWFEPTRPVVERVRVPLSPLPPALEGLRIVHLSDFHHGPIVRLEEIERGVEWANQLQPDLVALTGDFVSQAARYAIPCAQALSALHAPLGVFACLGNHDHWTNAERVAQALTDQGIVLLRNASQRLHVPGADLWIVGVDDVWEAQDDLAQALRGVPEEGFKLLLAHEPDFADEAARYGIDLQLSGHSHGGQVRLPLLGSPILPPHGRKYPWGLRRVGGLTVYTNRGLGRIFPPVRFRCRPEVTVLTLTGRNRRGAEES